MAKGNVNSKVSPQGSSGKRKRKLIEDTKQKLLSKCIDVLDKNPEVKSLQVDPFALYISSQLETLDKRRRLVTEKRINDILFQVRYEGYSEHEQNPREFSSPSQSTFGTYTAMLENNEMPNTFYRQ